MSNTRYAPGGDLYQLYSSKYGIGGADKLYQASLTDQPGAIAQQLSDLKYGPPLEQSTTAILTDQLYNEPLNAPIEQLNKVISNSVSSATKNSWVFTAAIVLVIAVVLYTLFSLGGLSGVKRRLL